MTTLRKTLLSWPSNFLPIVSVNTLLQMYYRNTIIFLTINEGFIAKKNYIIFHDLTFPNTEVFVGWFFYQTRKK